MTATTRKAPVAEDDKLVGYESASAMLGIKRGTLYALVHQGRVPHYRIGRRFVLFRVSELSRWLDAHRVDCENMP